MAEYNFLKFIYLLLLLFTITLAKDGELEDYIEYNLDDLNICKPALTYIPDIDDLRTNKHSAIKINLGHSFNNWYNSTNYKVCKFKIRASEFHGLFAVVQKLFLRGNGTHCFDYFNFYRENSKNSGKYCGSIDFINHRSDYFSKIFEKKEVYRKNENNNNTEKFEENDPEGNIITEIFISKKPLMKNESLDLVIAYTPYPKVCPRLKGETAYVDSNLYCIERKFECDGVFNCDSSKCSDELNCMSKIFSDESGASVTISAVTSLVICFIVFFFCLWICRKHEQLCWSSDCAGPEVNSGSVSGLPTDRGDQSANTPYIVTTPMLEVGIPSSLQDKDLPPSYDSLFPTQNTPTTTST